MLKFSRDVCKLFIKRKIKCRQLLQAASVMGEEDLRWLFFILANSQEKRA